MYDLKQVLLIRRDLNMRRGKEIAQGAHASLGFLKEIILGDKELSDKERLWLEKGSRKICLQVASEKELIEAFDRAKEQGLAVYLVEDSGKTEFAGRPTVTALAIGPDDAQKIDKVTADFKPY